jgi:hypothetical protein
MVGLSDPGQPFAARTFRRFARYLVLIGTKSLKEFVDPIRDLCLFPLVSFRLCERLLN